MVTCSVTSALNASARKNSCRRSRSKFETRVRATGTPKTRNDRPDTSTDAETSVSSIGTNAVPKRTMPRLSQGLAQHDPDVLDGVVLVDLHVALRLDGEVHEAVLRPRLQHVAEERDRRLHLRGARAVEVELQRDLRLLRFALDARLPCRARSAHALVPPSLVSRTSAALPCPTSPSTRVSAARCGAAAASPRGEYSITLDRLTKSSVPSGDAKRAVPAVGSTWFGPAT